MAGGSTCSLVTSYSRPRVSTRVGAPRCVELSYAGILLAGSSGEDAYGLAKRKER